MKTLDSISKIIGDTAQVNSQIKNIQKQIDEHRNNGTLDHFDVDSMVKNESNLIIQNFKSFIQTTYYNAYTNN
jgi:hypothetical protein